MGEEEERFKLACNRLVLVPKTLLSYSIFLGVGYVTSCVTGQRNVLEATKDILAFQLTPNPGRKKWSAYYPFDAYWEFKKSVALKSSPENSQTLKPTLLEGKLIIDALANTSWDADQFLEKIGTRPFEARE